MHGFLKSQESIYKKDKTPVSFSFPRPFTVLSANTSVKSMAEKRLAIVVDGTTQMAPHWKTILRTYLEKIIRIGRGIPVEEPNAEDEQTLADDGMMLDDEGVAASIDLDLKLLYMKAAFLHGDLEEELYLEQGFEFKGKMHMACNVVILLLYVDGMLIVGQNRKMIEELNKELSNCFEMKELGQARHIWEF
ncbi:hypothetical protein RJ639_003419 [Escallonia herrerae]|uniref:Reverse transcriptase Ty1/copia-type domain-containing protein n=1 Tax=Escallonia herrerae TaxID=1293975 RepID=A0AA89AUV9_9ASTE|nr:hypothetical protein RJ639_003419 [Escallonia herrerae]